MTETKLQKFKRLFPWVDPRYAIFPWLDPEELDATPLEPDIQSVKIQLTEQYVTPYKLTYLPGHILKLLIEASTSIGGARHDLTEEAIKQARITHLANIAKGIVKIPSDNPMPEAIKERLREINQSKKALKPVKPPTPKKVKPGPVFANVTRQHELLQKFPWAVSGSFKQDPDKTNGTICDIKCQKCGSTRTIHVADLFQVKLCKKCKTT